MNTTIRELGAGLQFGQSRLGLCPRCSGGQSRERSFSVTRYRDGLGFLCFRASCGFKGRLTSYGEPAIIDSPVPRAAFSTRPYTGATCLPEPYSDVWEAISRICPPFDVTPVWPLSTFYGVRGVPDEPRVQYFELRDFDGRKLGAITRTNHPDGTKDVRTWREAPGRLYSFYRPDGSQDSDTLWIVEDCLSAIRIAEYGGASAMALLGTHLNNSLLSEIRHSFPGRPVFVALDPGAEDAARDVVTKLRNFAGLEAVQVILTEDIHRMPFEEFKTLVNHYSGA